MAGKKKKSKVEIKAALDRIEKLKKEADRVRNDLREAVCVADEIADSFEDGSEDIAQALSTLRAAVERMSEYV